MQPHIREVDFATPDDAAGVVAVLDSYAADPTGDGRPLASDVRARLIPLLRDHPTALALLAFADGKPVGLAVCFFGVSTFRARPLLNIHDLAIIPEYRGRGVGRALLSEVEKRAVHKGCCKLTLEVQEDNARARALYQSFGFGDFRDNSAPTRFLSKPLDIEPQHPTTMPFHGGIS
jgi:ribosomal protein S18 acetylase RimI-like enzyme